MKPRLLADDVFFLHLPAGILHPSWAVMLPDDEIRRQVQAALAEDIGPGDVTSLATVPEAVTVRAAMVAREPLVVSGLALASAAFTQVSTQVAVTPLMADGSRAGARDVLLRAQGPARAILAAERVALNYLQRLSGIATFTAQFVAAVAGTRAVILDTRKTTPGWRGLEKYAVACGGGQNHRQGLYDRILIKDNHLVALRTEHSQPVPAAIQRARQAYPGLVVEVEADSLDEVRQAVEAGADIILLDNMTPAQLREAVKLVGGRARLEASGGITLQTVRAVAETGVDFISVGAITHSAPAVDIGLDFEASDAVRLQANPTAAERPGNVAAASS